VPPPLTPYGRQFELNGYAYGGGSLFIPLAGFVRPVSSVYSARAGVPLVQPLKRLLCSLIPRWGGRARI